MKNIIIILLLLPITVFASEDFVIGKCVIKNGSNSEKDILKIVSVQKYEYVTFSYFLSNGVLIQGQDYGQKLKNQINSNYSQVMCPNHERTFSPEKFIDKDS